MLMLLLAQEHVPRRCALLCPSLQIQCMAAHALPVCRGLGLSLHELELHDSVVETSEERVLSTPDNPVAVYLHDMLRPPLRLHTLPDTCRRLFRLPDGYDPVR